MLLNIYKKNVLFEVEAKSLQLSMVCLVFVFQGITFGKSLRCLLKRPSLPSELIFNEKETEKALNIATLFNNFFCRALKSSWQFTTLKEPPSSAFVKTSASENQFLNFVKTLTKGKSRGLENVRKHWKCVSNNC